MNKADQDFIREYCERYGVETEPGPGAPCLNGVPLVGEALRQLFMPAESAYVSFYGTTMVETSKLTRRKKPRSKEFMPSFYGYGLNTFSMQSDKLAS